MRWRAKLSTASVHSDQTSHQPSDWRVAPQCRANQLGPGGTASGLCLGAGIGQRLLQAVVVGAGGQPAAVGADGPG
jgi:hypothetical protein